MAKDDSAFIRLNNLEKYKDPHGDYINWKVKPIILAWNYFHIFYKRYYPLHSSTWQLIQWPMKSTWVGKHLFTIFAQYSNSPDPEFMCFLLFFCFLFMNSIGYTAIRFCMREKRLKNQTGTKKPNSGNLRLRTQLLNSSLLNFHGSLFVWTKLIL